MSGNTTAGIDRHCGYMEPFSFIRATEKLWPIQKVLRIGEQIDSEGTIV